eukprot:12419797-Karenia_brevis.AAC.1
MNQHDLEITSDSSNPTDDSECEVNVATTLRINGKVVDVTGMQGVLKSSQSVQTMRKASNEMTDSLPDSSYSDSLFAVEPKIEIKRTRRPNKGFCQGVDGQPCCFSLLSHGKPEKTWTMCRICDSQQLKAIAENVKGGELTIVLK